MVRALILFLLLPAAAQAEVPARYRQAAAEYGLPAKVGYAVALTERGLRLQSGRARPWPWTLNIEGRGHYYPTRKTAYRALKVYLDRGGRRAHVGIRAGGMSAGQIETPIAEGQVLPDRLQACLRSRVWSAAIGSDLNMTGFPWSQISVLTMARHMG